jgi:putative aldouronate transport system permease protein
MLSRTLKTVSRNKVLLMMLIPAVLWVVIFHYIPMGGVILAFKQYRYDLGILGSKWVGFDNFKFFFQSGQAWFVTRNTLLYNIAFLAINTFLQILFAIILSEITSKYFKKIVQSFMFLPYFISWVIVASIAYNLLNYENGSLNTFLRAIGAEPVNVYGTPEYWKYILIVFKAWKSVGYGMVVYLAAITGMDAELQQAAEIDGANIFQRIRYIVLPYIVPTLTILTLLNIGQIFRGDFGLFYQLVGNNGALFDATDIIDTYVFRSLLQSSETGMAAAAGFYQSVMCFATIMLTNYIVKRVEADYALF